MRRKLKRRGTGTPCTKSPQQESSQVAVPINEQIRELLTRFDEAGAAPILLSDKTHTAYLVSEADYEIIRQVQLKSLFEQMDKLGAEAKANGLTEEILAEILAEINDELNTKASAEA